jgi:hypothetical protein
MTTTHGPFATFEQMMDDAKDRAPYVEAAFHAALEEQIFHHMDYHGSHHPEEIIDRLAKQCGLVIDTKYFHGRPRYTYQLVEAEVFGEQFEQVAA